MKELLALRREKKEKVRDFSQIFATHLNNFSAAIKPNEKTMIEYYTSALGSDIAMFVKISVKPSLAKTYEESKKIEVELESVNKYSMESNTRPFSGKKPLLFTRPKYEHSHELESVVNMVQNLSNNIVDLEKDKEANSDRK